MVGAEAWFGPRLPLFSNSHISRAQVLRSLRWHRHYVATNDKASAEVRVEGAACSPIPTDGGICFALPFGVGHKGE